MLYIRIYIVPSCCQGRRSFLSVLSDGSRARLIFCRKLYVDCRLDFSCNVSSDTVKYTHTVGDWQVCDCTIRVTCILYISNTKYAHFDILFSLRILFLTIIHLSLSVAQCMRDRIKDRRSQRALSYFSISYKNDNVYINSVILPHSNLITARPHCS